MTEMEAARCKHEKSVLDETSKRPKSLCTMRGSAIWTNCREVGHCTLQKELDAEELEVGEE